MIDLRTDTVTRPTAGMSAAMSAAEVGFDSVSVCFSKGLPYALQLMRHIRHEAESRVWPLQDLLAYRYPMQRTAH